MSKLETVGPTSVERMSETDLVVTRVFAAPVASVFRAWTTPDLFKLWWAPQSMGVPILDVQMDLRVGGRYSVTFGHDPAEAMTFFGDYVEVEPNARLVWTNDESGETTITTVTFTPDPAGTRLVLHEAYPSKEALDEACIGMEGSMPEQFLQLDALLARMVEAG
ncbi:SRPBCC domain-containing protein [Rhizobium wuzhouense]|uniref:ATPase n=1 Tax=Rhizobium wuzhouense TaxID=1986026 RepID=A0ABX5NXB6_9HYPH|nr:SRPBCC domain-containing protein [Rhizobium wuzhouense]PYB76923.1 ATPase [Rhizobium wuzhouense]